ncbi:MAG: DUF6297 family protein [Propionibacteriaceae bacterium]|jgi:hypothetical protein|nr:DUF6297 family protein [Propionibacteriaceae bacterium]
MAKKRSPQGYKAKPTPPPEPKPKAEPKPKPEKAKVTPVEEPDLETETEAPDWPRWEHSLSSVEPEPIWESDLKRMLRDWRRGRATKSIINVLMDGYVTMFAIVIIVAMLSAAVVQAQGSAQECGTDACHIGRTLLPWVAMGASFALTAMASRIFGPIVASAAEGFWLMDAPIRRGRLLWKRLIGVVIAVLLIAAGIGGLLSGLTGYSPDEVWRWALAMGAGAAGLTALAAAEQTWGRTWLISLLQWLSGLIAVGVLFVVVAVAAGWFKLDLSTLPTHEAVLWVAIAGGVLLIPGIVVALGRLGQIHRARLVSGGTLVAGMQGAAFAMDFALMRDILVERDAMRRGHVRPQRGSGSGANALVWRELQRLWRYPKRVILLFASVVVPYAVKALGFHTFSPFITSLILLVGFVPLLGSMRVLSRTKGLSRMLPLSNPQIRRATAMVPIMFAVVWATICSPAFIDPTSETDTLVQGFIKAALTAATGLLAAIRWVTAKSANYSAPMMQTGFGAMPPGLIFNLFRGIDIVVLISGPLMLGWSLWIPVIIAVVVTFALSGAFSMEEMQAQQEEMKKQQAKNGQGGGGGLFGSRPAAPAPVTKQKIAPPKGYSSPRVQ